MARRPQKIGGDLLRRLILMDASYGHLNRDIAVKYGISETQVSRIINEPQNKVEIAKRQDDIVRISQERMDKFITEMVSDYMELCGDVMKDLMEEVKECQTTGKQFKADTVFEKQIPQRDGSHKPVERLVKMKQKYDIDTRIKLFEKVIKPIMMIRQQKGFE